MKKLFTILILLISTACFSQDYLQKNDTIIKLSGFDLVSNNIRYDLITAQGTTGQIKYIPELWQFTEEKIGVLDVTKSLWRVCNDAIIQVIHKYHFTDYEIKSD